MPSKDNEEDLKEDRGRTGRQEDLLCNSRGGKGGKDGVGLSSEATPRGATRGTLLSMG